ncbi:MAG: protein of unknown function DUF755 [Anelloviridae sp.]|nr:MAG: protein of unknown function DUF755 [Anelloviridae sp.]
MKGEDSLQKKLHKESKHTQKLKKIFFQLQNQQQAAQYGPTKKHRQRTHRQRKKRKHRSRHNSSTSEESKESSDTESTSYSTD